MSLEVPKQQVSQFAGGMLERIEADPPPLGALKEGLPYVGSAVLGALLMGSRFPRLGRLLWLLAAMLLFFFRDPPRAFPQDDQFIYAAADGRIMAVDTVTDDWFLEGQATRIVTFLSMLNVHVNRSPVLGEVVKLQWKPGTFGNTLSLQKSEANEQNMVAINGPRGKITVVQVAGLLARRIVCWVGEGHQLRAGQKFGMIKFGSRTDVLAPHGSIEVLVKPGQQVRAGVTRIARYITPDA